MAKAKVVKTSDLNVPVAARLFELLNYGKIKIKGTTSLNTIIITDEEPINLVYPEGWYYGKGCFRNKHNSTNGVYGEAIMYNTKGEPWELSATYCTR